MAALARDDDDALISAINVTPLVDVVLVLLVVLMVTASYVVQRGLPLDPPEAHQAAATPSGALEVVVDALDRVYVGDRIVDDAALSEVARSYVAGTTAPRATIAADRAARHGEVVRVIDLLHEAHLDHFAIRVREPTP